MEEFLNIVYKVTQIAYWIMVIVFLYDLIGRIEITIEKDKDEE